MLPCRLSAVALLPQVAGMQGQLQNLQNPMQNENAESQWSGEVSLPFPWTYHPCHMEWVTWHHCLAQFEMLKGLSRVEGSRMWECGPPLPTPQDRGQQGSRWARGERAGQDPGPRRQDAGSCEHVPGRQWEAHTHAVLSGWTSLTKHKLR